MVEWTGPTCVMCNGTGKHVRGWTVQCEGDLTARTIFYYEQSDLRCGACNGHGRDAE